MDLIQFRQEVASSPIAIVAREGAGERRERIVHSLIERFPTNKEAEQIFCKTVASGQASVNIRLTSCSGWMLNAYPKSVNEQIEKLLEPRCEKLCRKMNVPGLEVYILASNISRMVWLHITIHV
jgi:hypothetical protein